MEPEISNELVSDILKNIKLKLNLAQPTTPDELKEYQYKLDLITLYIRTICTNILIRTNRNKFPDQLKYLVVDLVIDKLFLNKNDEELQSIQSMTEYDRTVNFGASTTIKTKLDLLAKRQLDEYDILINRFRLLYKT